MIGYDDAELLLDADEAVERLIKQIGAYRSDKLKLYRLREMLMDARETIYTELESAEDDCND